MTAFRVLGVVSFLLAISAADARGQMFVSTGADTLRGLPGIEVIVDSLQPELESGGLTNAALRADVEGRLRKGGVTIYPSQMANPSPAKPSSTLRSTHSRCQRVRATPWAYKCTCDKPFARRSRTRTS